MGAVLHAGPESTNQRTGMHHNDTMMTSAGDLIQNIPTVRDQQFDSPSLHFGEASFVLAVSENWGVIFVAVLVIKSPTVWCPHDGPQFFGSSHFFSGRPDVSTKPPKKALKQQGLAWSRSLHTIQASKPLGGL